MQSAFRAWIKACQADAEDEYTDGTFGEHCEANEYEFWEDGRFYSKRTPTSASHGLVGQEKPSLEKP